MTLVSLSNPCDHLSLMDALNDAGVLDAARKDMIVIHVSNGCFITPSAMALLGAWGLRVRSVGTRLSFDGDDDVLRYMSRMDVFRALDVAFNESFDRHVEVGRFIPMKLIANSIDCKSTVDAICDLVVRQFENANQFLPALEWAVNEIVDNILIHAESPSPGVVCAQFYPAQERIEIGVCDMGRGLKASLSESHT